MVRLTVKRYSERIKENRKNKNMYIYIETEIKQETKKKNERYVELFFPVNASISNTTMRDADDHVQQERL